MKSTNCVQDVSVVGEIKVVERSIDWRERLFHPIAWKQNAEKIVLINTQSNLLYLVLPEALEEPLLF